MCASTASLECQPKPLTHPECYLKNKKNHAEREVTDQLLRSPQTLLGEGGSVALRTDLQRINQAARVTADGTAL